MIVWAGDGVGALALNTGGRYLSPIVPLSSQLKDVDGLGVICADSQLARAGCDLLLNFTAKLHW